jgi:hypothetical protein
VQGLKWDIFRIHRFTIERFAGYTITNRLIFFNIGLLFLRILRKLLFYMHKLIFNLPQPDPAFLDKLLPSLQFGQPFIDVKVFILKPVINFL